ncbi:hypothetical protein J2Z21_005546 [Streptomyces griseochromogenes]|uniref:Chaplin domain-containing protein n=1 Tax=Streptomyces griseochromogenes TaxID=68214 RepID=A0A1B1BAE0_9ACTN|nr:hypothetical protein [Streptomyces griseochromogenes]ANP55793.1 hypothetical protein AVL59_44865 [Streptomyces griseochromogenes]MBP2052559.1 hypothetical protein [Streptomyces griseochromogenes]
MMKKLLVTAFLATSVAALAAPAHADEGEYDIRAVKCAENFALLPVLQPISPLSFAAGGLAAIPTCTTGSAVGQING